MDRKFYKTVFKVEVLSEDTPTDDLELSEVAREIVYGGCSGVTSVESIVELTPKQMAEALIEQGSDPKFFTLDEEGNPKEGD